MQLSKQIRIPFLAITCISIFLGLAKLILDPNAGNQKVAQFTFPQDVPLTGSEIIESQALTDIVIQKIGEYDAVIAGRRYEYRQNNAPIDIEIRYVIGTMGNIEGLVADNKNLTLPGSEISKSIRYQPGIGYYSQFVHKNKVYLTSCINPQGKSTVTQEQFLKNQRTYSITASSLLSWLLGEQSLLNRRCLWVNLSTPVNDVNPKLAFSKLEKAWFDLYRWWYPRFPKH
ncbi:cyanoexosortase A system-associated protein [Cronbergia sp. UHCC 0137]|uniref:cyanoexosortase A system-associated protein n=1 Tax=Cronbergia sp. UHCC 0137 TaxID=3110239 RepID=UPI002B20AB11|nr:cyanoexosortase A system-associated protein [Cronbergia sp. UHCC 0137]MEA5620207.1 cyanoexosortase A system-associated protein [Cronbergia sp. UHCC 0137]